MPRSSGLIHEQLVKKVENSLNDAIEGARQAEISDEELFEILRLLLKVM